MDKNKVCVIMPAMNEEETIGRVVGELLKEKILDDVIVIDDSSSDNTGKIARQQGATVFRNMENKGYDKSLEIGFQKASEKNCNVVVTFDADGQHKPKDLRKMLGPILNDQGDIVVGIRPKKQRLAEKIYSIYSGFSIGIKDPLCGLKVYKSEVYKSVGYFDSCVSIGTELMFKAYDKGYKILQTEISIDKRRDEPRFGRIIISNYNIIRAMFKMMLRRVKR